MNTRLTAFRPTSGLLALAVVMSVPAVTAVSRSTDTPRVDARPALASALTPQLDARSVTTRSLRSLPTSGTGWSTLKRTADGSLGSVNLADQNNTNAGRVMAAALVYARTGSSTYRTKVVKQLAAVPHARLGKARVLSVGRQVAGYAIAADLVDYQSAPFRHWMSGIRTRYIGNHGRWVRLNQTSSDTANNWGAWAMASRVAADAYLGKHKDMARAARVFRGFLGNRAAYHGFHRTGDFDRSWVCGSARRWVPINPAGCGSKSGAVVEDISRSTGHFPRVNDEGRTYVWETLGGATLTATILKGHGYSKVWKWSNSALLRAARFQQSHGGYRPLYSVNQYIPWTINKAYGVHLGPVASSAGYGRQYGFTDWIS